MEFKKYDKIKVIGHEDNEGIFHNKKDEIFITEKVDGANMRLMIKDGKIIFGSRTQQLTSDEGEDTNIQKNFIRSVNFIRERIWSKVDVSEFKKYEKCIFFGEAMIKHTMDYDWDKVPPFLGFDIYDEENERYLNTKESISIFGSLGLEMVPIIWIGKAQELNKFLTK